MDKATVYTKTAKGITQVNQRSASLSKDLMKVLKLIDGKSNFGQLLEKAEIDKGALEKALNTLAKDGFARVFETRKEEADPFAADDDFDFTAPNKMPSATQRVVAGAANDISELVRQADKVDSDKKAREQAHEQARAKARTEAESRAKLEAEARAKAEAEKKAMEQAQRAKEASERARIELETKMREEEARKKAIAEQQVKLTVEQKAKEEAESRRLAELRVRAEKEAKALAEARARAEAEAAALAKARAEAENAAKRQAEEAKGAEAEMKARLKDEIEARIRGEMEELLRTEVEEKSEVSREQMKAEIMAEARLAAKAELEERMRGERESLQKAEMEARVKAERDSNARAEMEAKKRAEAEARAQAESTARIKAEEEARRLRAQAEEHARAAQAAEAARRVEAESRAKEQQEVAGRIEAERRGKYEAEARAKIEAEEADKRRRELEQAIESERKAKEEAEARARIESRARETVAADTRAQVQAELESNLEKRAEIEGKAQAKAYMSAKAKAELDEDERLRTEQARRAKEIADVLRTKVESDSEAPAAAPEKRRRRGRRKGLVKTLFVGLALAVLIGVGLLHVVPLRTLAIKVEHALSAWLHDDVSIASLTFRLVPTPHLRVENVAVGKLLDAKAASGRIYLDIFTLLGDKLSLNSIELENVSIGAEAVRRIPTWGNPEGKGAAGGIDTIKLKGVKLDVKPAIDPFDAQLAFARNGSFTAARLTGAGWTLGLKPEETGTAIDFNARNWIIPAGGIAIPVSDVALRGTLTGNTITVPEFEASAMEGKVQGTLRVSWGSGVKLESDLSLARMDAKQLVAAFTKDIAVVGKLEGNFNIVTEGPSVEKLFQNPRAQGKFKIGEGSISNVDLVAVMQSDTAGQRAGVTKFAELTGEYAGAEHRASYRQISLQGGVLRGNGVLDIGASSSLSGRLSLEIRSQVAQDRGAFTVSGTVSRPIVRRGG